MLERECEEHAAQRAAADERAPQARAKFKGLCVWSRGLGMRGETARRGVCTRHRARLRMVRTPDVVVYPVCENSGTGVCSHLPGLQAPVQAPVPPPLLLRPLTLSHTLTTRSLKRHAYYPGPPRGTTTRSTHAHEHTHAADTARLLSSGRPGAPPNTVPCTRTHTCAHSHSLSHAHTHTQRLTYRTRRHNCPTAPQRANSLFGLIATYSHTHTHTAHLAHGGSLTQ